MRRYLTLLTLFALTAGTALAGPPRPPGPGRGGPPGLEAGRPRDGSRVPPPHVIDNLRAREAEILAWVAKNDPDAHKSLLALKTADERAFTGQLLRASRLMERSERDPEVVERHRRMSALEDQIRERSRGWEALEPGEQATRKTEVQALVAELFEIRQDERRAHLQELEERMAELRREIDEREADKATIVEDYVDDRLRARPDL